MAMVIAIIGNIGTGKTTLAAALQREGGFRLGSEEHETRPFQRRFMHDLQGYAFSNQVDYLVFRAEQELMLRRGEKIGLLDGGLDMDFEVFTRLFHRNGYLSDLEFELCERLYSLIRQLLPPPELYLYLQAPRRTLTARLAQRRRPLGIAGAVDIPALEALLADWVGRLADVPVLMLDAGAETFCTSPFLTQLVEDIGKRIPGEG